MRSPLALLTALVLLLAVPVRGASVTLVARTLDRDGVTVAFPAITYDPPADAAGDPAAVCARMASAALGVTVDPVRDLVVVTGHRVVLKDPSDQHRLLKIYRPDRYDGERVAKYLQRDLGLERFLRDQGLRVATIDRAPHLIERGVLRQERVRGTSLERLYPNGYPSGANPAIDRALARIAAVDRPLIGIVSRQSGLLLSNTVDCHDEVPLGIDVGYCRGNIFVEDETGDVVLIDW